MRPMRGEKYRPQIERFDMRIHRNNFSLYTLY